jgi:ABC-type bacteriocin/lantibiotic exporter with double-glycine peptidase domain
MKNELTPMARFWRLLQPDKKEIRNVYAYAIFNGLIGLSLPLGIQAIVNLIQGGQINTSWIVLVVFVVMGVAATGILQIFQLRITESLQQKIFTRAALEFSYRIPRIKLEALYKYHAPELMNRFFDVVSVQKGLSKILIDFSAASLQVIFGLILLSLYHPFFILFSLVLIILVYAIFRFTAKKGLETSLMESKYKYKVVHWLEELARTAQTFKLSGDTSLPLERTDVEVSSYLEARESHFSILVKQYSLMVVFKVVVATGLLAIGGILVMEQLMNIGQFIAAEIIILMVRSSVEKLILSLETIYDVLTSLEKVGQVTDLELEVYEGENLESHCVDCGMDVELKNVVFTYPTKKESILKGVDLKIERSEKLVVTGNNSSGKSTLLHVIAGLYDVQGGYISYGGLSKGNINLNSLRSVIGDSFNQEVLFEGSLLDNISIGRKNADLSSVQWALENVGLNEFVKSLPKGLNSDIEPMGKGLPRSVVQKLLLARSIADKPKLLLIEDSLEHLDVEERHQIANFLFDAKQTWTLVMISTDKSIMERADRWIELKDGKVVETKKRIKH